jgi:hypothetical protein
MITLLRSAVALVVAAACLAAPASVLAGSNDAAATSTYLRVDHRYLKELSARLPAAKTGTASVVGKLTSECPGIAAQAPAGHDLEAFAAESRRSSSCKKGLGSYAPSSLPRRAADARGRRGAIRGTNLRIAPAANMPTLRGDRTRPSGYRPVRSPPTAMELGGLEPPTSWVRSRRSPN